MYDDLVKQTNMMLDRFGNNTVKWIPVTERLPERHKNVLCCGARGGMFVGWFANVAAISGGKTTAFVHGGNGRCVTHWMPLPQPPKEE